MLVRLAKRCCCCWQPNTQGDMEMQLPLLDVGAEPGGAEAGRPIGQQPSQSELRQDDLIGQLSPKHWCAAEGRAEQVVLHVCAL